MVSKWHNKIVVCIIVTIGSITSDNIYVKVLIYIQHQGVEVSCKGKCNNTFRPHQTANQIEVNQRKLYRTSSGLDEYQTGFGE